MSTVGGIGRLDAVADRYKSAYEYDANGNILTAQRYDGNGDQYDDLAYHYEQENNKLLRNRLYHLNESIDGGYGDIGTDASAFHGGHADVNTLNNYQYDALGNLIGDKREEIGNIEWTVSGKVKHITRTVGSTKPELSFAYGADGQRISKTVGDPMNGGFREWYLRDAQGNIMAIYRYTNTTGAGPSLKVTERPVYGSARIGSYTRQMELYHEPTVHAWPYLQPMQAPLKRYELTDHLGNVAAVVTGRLLPGNNTGSPYQAELVSAQGYEPFGSLLPGRNYSSDSYRFGFNGQEKDDQVYGATGTSYDFGSRLYDPRVGRWLSLDPLADKYPGYAPYSFCVDNPIIFVDLGGLRVVLAAGLTPEETARAEAAIKLVQERQPKFYAYLQTLRYNPAINGGAFLSPGDEGYDSEEAFDVIITVGIKDIDGIPRSKEIKNRFDSSTRLSNGSDYDLQGRESLVENNAGYGGGLEPNRDDKTVSVWAKGNTESKTKISTVEESQTTELIFGILRLKNSDGPHFAVSLDDFIGQGAATDGEVLSHEFGHVEGEILYQLNAAFFGTTGRQTQGGHEPGNLGGENAVHRAKEFVDAGKQH